MYGVLTENDEELDFKGDFWERFTQLAHKEKMFHQRMRMRAKKRRIIRRKDGFIIRRR